MGRKRRNRNKKKNNPQPKEKFIQKAVKTKGRLRNYVRREYGAEGFTKRGTIKKAVKQRIADRKVSPKGTKPSKSIEKAAQLGITLQELPKRKKK